MRGTGVSMSRCPTAANFRARQDSSARMRSRLASTEVHTIAINVATAGINHHATALTGTTVRGALPLQTSRLTHVMTPTTVRIGKQSGGCMVG